MAADLSHLRSLLEKATPGPWSVDWSTEDGAWHIGLRAAVICKRGPWTHNAQTSLANAALIVALINSASPMIEEIEGLRGDLGQWREKAIQEEAGRISWEFRAQTAEAERDALKQRVEELDGVLQWIIKELDAVSSNADLALGMRNWATAKWLVVSAHSLLPQTVEGGES